MHYHVNDDDDRLEFHHNFDKQWEFVVRLFFDVRLTTISFVERFNGKDRNSDGRVPFEMTIDDVNKDDNDEFDVVTGGDECLVDDNDC